MPPGSASKKSTKKDPTKKGATRKDATKPKKSWHCKLCDRAIRLPDGWTRGPAVRRHYWAKHREVMQPGFGKNPR